MSSLQAHDGARVASAADEAALAVKEARLHARLEEFESLLIAYSGGVDSAFLALRGLARARRSPALRDRRQPELSAPPS